MYFDTGDSAPLQDVDHGRARISGSGFLRFSQKVFEPVRGGRPEPEHVLEFWGNGLRYPSMSKHWEEGKELLKLLGGEEMLGFSVSAKNFKYVTYGKNYNYVQFDLLENKRISICSFSLELDAVHPGISGVSIEMTEKIPFWSLRRIFGPGPQTERELTWIGDDENRLKEAFKKVTGFDPSPL